jgi:hypothetical protein
MPDDVKGIVYIEKKNPLGDCKLAQGEQLSVIFKTIRSVRTWRIRKTVKKY